jgi:hypothetical protein
MMLPVYTNVHYAAPTAAALYALLMLSFRRLRHWRLVDKPAGIFLIRATMSGAVTLLLLRAAIPVFNLPIVNSNRPQTWCSPWHQLLPRAAVQARLETTPGEHLVLVHFSPQHDATNDLPWVNNSADIDHSKIVWAYDMGQQDNAELLRYFAERRVWVLDVDTSPPGLKEISRSDAGPRSGSRFPTNQQVVHP